MSFWHGGMYKASSGRLGRSMWRMGTIGSSLATVLVFENMSSSSPTYRLPRPLPLPLLSKTSAKGTERQRMLASFSGNRGLILRKPKIWGFLWQQVSFQAGLLLPGSATACSTMLSSWS